MSFKGVNEDEFSLPLANAKNRQLQQQVREKRAKLAQLTFEIDQNENLLRSDEQEVATLEQSTIQTNNLAHNFRSQIQKECEISKVTNSTANALDQETKRLRQKLAEVLEHHQQQQKKLADQEKNFEQFSRAFEEEAKVVEVMEKMVASQQDDQSILEKYSHQDNARIKDLELKLVRAKEESVEADRLFKLAREERENAAIQLNNMQEEFRSMMDDRNQSLQRWEMTLVQTQLCRNQLEQTRQEYQNIKVLANADQNRLDDVNRCIKQLQDDIKNLERTLYARELVAAQLKLQLDERERIINEQQAEYVTMGKVAKRLSAEIITARSNADKLKEKLAGIRSTLTDEHAKYKVLEEQLESMKTTVGSTKAQKESLSRLSKAADERLTRQRSRLNELANEHVRIEYDLRLTKTSISSTETKLKLCASSMRHLDEQVHSTKQLMKQREEFLYKKNIEILRVETELRRLRSSLGNLEERQRQKQQIEVLKEELDASNSYLVALKYEMSKTQSDLIGLQRNCDIQQQRKNVLETLSRQLQSECEKRERECNDLRRELEEIRMGESLIHLEIKRRESLIQTKSTAVEQLENQKKFIELAIETRKDELAGQMELLQLEYRSLKERTQQLTIEISKKSAEIERIKLRYDMVASTLITENGPSETSEAYFIIKMAQEKELLKESINDLENLVTKLESDNLALNNTVKLIASSNQQFRQHTIVGVLTDDDKALKVKMEHQQNILEKTVTLLRKELYKEKNRIDLLEQEIKQLKEEAYRVKFSVEEKEIIYKDALGEVEKIKNKIKRARDLNIQMQKLVRRAKKTKSKLEEEIDFEIAQLREHVQCAQTTMVGFAQNDANFRTSLEKYLEELMFGASSTRENDGNELQNNALPVKMRLDITDFPLPSPAAGSRGSTGSLMGHDDSEG